MGRNIEGLLMGLSCLAVSGIAGCATMSNRTRTLVAMGIAGVAAGAAGAALAPTDENRLAHGVLWGGPIAAGAGAVGLFVFDENARRRGAEDRASRLEKELASLTDEPEPEVVAKNRVGIEKPLPPGLRNLVTPGQWSLYKIDRWVSSSDSEMTHQDLIFRFNQPQLNPGGRPLTASGSNGGVASEGAATEAPPSKEGRANEGAR